MRLSDDVFVALAAIAWADGNMTDVEREALLGAARACGCDDERIAGVEKRIASYVDLNDMARLNLQNEERTFVYGLAMWLAGVDGLVAPNEQHALETLRTLLGITEVEAERARTTSNVMKTLAGARSTRDIVLLAQNMDRAAQMTIDATVLK